MGGNHSNGTNKKQFDAISSWIDSHLTVDEIQEALFNENSLRILLDRIALGSQGNNKSSGPSSITQADSIEYCLSSHQRHRLLASVAITNSLVEGGIVDKGLSFICFI